MTQHADDPDSYWVTNERAAAILGVDWARLNQLAAKDFLPFEIHADGTRLYRRQQLEVVGNARGSAGASVDQVTWNSPSRSHSSF